MSSCKYCSKNISPEAKTCPHCGQPDPVAPCFPGDAAVLTPSGLRLIKDISRGDMVISLNRNSGKTVARMVTAKFSHSATEIWEILFADSNNRVRSTRNHTFLTKRGWLRVDELQAGDQLVGATSENVPQIVSSIQPSNEREAVYNLHTAQEHNFIVNGVVAHNFTRFRVLRTALHYLLFDSIAMMSFFLGNHREQSI